MSRLAIIFFLNVVVSWGVAEWVCRRAHVLRLFQFPNHRSSHIRPTPSGGGLGIVLAGSLAGVALGSYYEWPISLLMVGLAACLAAVGFIDDIRHIPARWRFGVQVLVCMCLMLELGDLPELSFSTGIVFEMSGFALFGLFLAGVWWINLFNFMDGIDGLAGMQAIYMLLAGGLIAVWSTSEVVTSPVWIWMMCIAAATLGFLLLNWPPAKIFMGDVGSTWLAFMVFALGLLSVQYGWMCYSAWLVLAAAFVTDASVTLLTRIFLGESWYKAHSCHAYQRLSRRWHSDRNVGHRSVMLLVLAVNGIWLAPLAWACVYWPAGAVAFVFIAYLPLVFAAFWLGAGRPDKFCRTVGD